MNRKRIIQVIIIVMCLILAFFLINLGRKVYIITAFVNKTKEYNNITNFYKKLAIDEKYSTEIWRNGNIAFYQMTSNDGTKGIYVCDEYSWIILDTKDENGNVIKTATKTPREETVLQPLVASPFYAENLWEIIRFANFYKITTEKLGETDCYKFYISDREQFFINKDNFLLVREITDLTDTGIIEYKINEISEEELKEPNLEGFTILSK